MDDTRKLLMALIDYLGLEVFESEAEPFKQVFSGYVPRGEHRPEVLVTPIDYKVVPKAYKEAESSKNPWDNTEIMGLLIDMFDAEEKHGCGFYDSEPWVSHYDALRQKLGRKNRFLHASDTE